MVDYKGDPVHEYKSDPAYLERQREFAKRYLRPDREHALEWINRLKETSEGRELLSKELERLIALEFTAGDSQTWLIGLLRDAIEGR